MANTLICILAFCIVLGFCHCGWTMAIIALWVFFAYQIITMIEVFTSSDKGLNPLGVMLTAAAGIALLLLYFPHLLHPV